MSLCQLVYISRSGTAISPAELAELAGRAADANLARDVTGTLLYCRGFFLQMLEGDGTVVRPLFEKISRDPRHADVHVLADGTVAKRMFPSWGMSFLHLDLAHIEEAARARALIARLRRYRDFGGLGEEANRMILDLRRAIDTESGRRVAA